MMAKKRKGNIIWSGFRAAVMATLLVVFFGGLWSMRTYAKDNTASTMRMKKTEGTVKVLGSSGKEVAVFENMKLQSGNEIDTLEKSYAWISLDDAKLLKMDAVSEAGVRKKGKKLEVFLESGSLFFNVTEPLEDDETLNIRTSTMTVGIRGTSGWVNVIDSGNVKVSVLEGTVKVSVFDSLTGQVKQDNVSAGESAVCVVYDEDKVGGVERCDILKENYTEKDVKGFVLMEVASDKAFCEEIYQQSGIDLRNLQETPQQRLQEDEDNMRSALEKIEVVLKEQASHISAQPVWGGQEKEKTDVPKDLESSADLSGMGRPKGTNQPNASESAAQPKNTENAGDGVPNVKQDEAKKPTIPTVPSDNGDSGSQGNSGSSGGSGSSGSQGNSGGSETPNPSEPSEPPIHTGDDISYAYDQEKMTLTIYPTISNKLVALPDYEAGKQPWARYVREMERVVLKNGITAIGNNAFLPDTETPVSFSVMRAGEATSECANLRNVTFPKSVKSISADAFEGCPNIATVYFGGTETEWNNNKDSSFSGISSAGTDNKKIYFSTGENGEESYYYFDEPAKTLTIAGDGKMADYSIPVPDYFSNSPWMGHRLNIQKLVVEDGVTSIGNYAFYYCENLNSVTIPDSVTMLNSVTMPNSVMSIGDYAFYRCKALRGNLEIPNSVTSIGNGAFYECISLSGKLEIPTNVTSIGNYAFYYCKSLSDKLEISNSVESIGMGAFMLCVSLSDKLEIPTSVTSIGDYAFDGCSGLSSVTIPTSVTSIGKAVFYGCSGLSSVTIPTSVTSIGDFAFSRCSGLSSVTIPTSVTSIGDYAFDYCSGLRNVTIPKSVTSIGKAAFLQCDSLTAFAIAEDNAKFSVDSDGVLFNKDGTTLLCYPTGKKGSYIIPSGVTSIGESAFNGCKGLSSVTIPSSVTSIVTSIDSFTFAGSAISQINYGGSETQWKALVQNNKIYFRNPPNMTYDYPIPAGDSVGLDDGGAESFSISDNDIEAQSTVSENEGRE